jgi:hypothetical protein
MIHLFDGKTILLVADRRLGFFGARTKLLVLSQTRAEELSGKRIERSFPGSHVCLLQANWLASCRRVCFSCRYGMISILNGLLGERSPICGCRAGRPWKDSLASPRETPGQLTALCLGIAIVSVCRRRSDSSFLRTDPNFRMANFMPTECGTTLCWALPGCIYSVDSGMLESAPCLGVVAGATGPIARHRFAFGFRHLENGPAT